MSKKLLRQTMTDAYIFQADLWCVSCAPEVADGPYPNGGGEADAPWHCAGCMVPLKNPLTGDGVRYVLEAIEKELQNPDRWKIHEIYDGTYYEGAPHIYIVEDWANQIADYGLDEKQQELLEKFFEEVERGYA